MWQRIQTLYLFLAMIINLSLFWITLANVNLNGILYKINLYRLSSVETGETLVSNMMPANIIYVAILLNILSIALFKKRQIQIKISQLNLLVQAAFLVAVFFIIDGTVDSVTGTININESTIEYQFGAYLALIPILFIFLAIKGIKKDEALVRAADRIR